MSYDLESDKMQEELKKHHDKLKLILSEIEKKIVGQESMGTRLLMALAAGGHVLLEGLPGLAKTTAIKALSECTSLAFKRVQFTPDLLPADVMGTQIYDPSTATFKVKKGPIFANLILADEINRAPAKVQSALLEAMEERQVTIGETTFNLDAPFLVMATQNPIEQEGTYVLPEAQIDRFLFKLSITYTSDQNEVEIMRRAQDEHRPTIKMVASKEDLLSIQKFINKIYVSDKVRKYIVDLVFATREPLKRGFKDIAHLIEYGASPRASLNLERVIRVNALLEGRAFVTPQDVKDVGMDVLRHRVKPSFEAEAENIKSEAILSRIFDRVDVP